MSCVMRKSVFGVSDTNLAVQSQKMAKGLNNNYMEGSGSATIK